MKNQIKLAIILMGVTLSSFGQLSFDQNNFEATNYSVDSFDYAVKGFLTNTSEDPADTLFAWELKKIAVSSDWLTTVCFGLKQCIEEPKIPYNFTLNNGETEFIKLSYAFFGELGEGESYVVAYSLKDPSNRDSMRLNVTLTSVEEAKKINLNIYPNPVKDNVYVDYNAANYTVNIYDLLGNLRLSQNINRGEALNVYDLSQGVYLVRIDGDLSFSKLLQKE